jgi:hypothetical protein
MLDIRVLQAWARQAVVALDGLGAVSPELVHEVQAVCDIVADVRSASERRSHRGSGVKDEGEPAAGSGQEPQAAPQSSGGDSATTPPTAATLSSLSYEGTACVYDGVFFAFRGGWTVHFHHVQAYAGERIEPIVPQPSSFDSTSRFSIAPALPDGLTLDSGSGVISGKPEQAAGLQVFEVTCDTGAVGEALSVPLRARLQLEVKRREPPAGLRYGCSKYVFAEGGGGLPLQPQPGLPITVVMCGGGAATRFTVRPALPPGFRLAAATGAIESDGAARAACAPQPYEVTAANAGGHCSTKLAIEVQSETSAHAASAAGAGAGLASAEAALAEAAGGDLYAAVAATVVAAARVAVPEFTAGNLTGLCKIDVKGWEAEAALGAYQLRVDRRFYGKLVGAARKAGHEVAVGCIVPAFGAALAAGCAPGGGTLVEEWHLCDMFLYARVNDQA